MLVRLQQRGLNQFIYYLLKFIIMENLNLIQTISQVENINEVKNFSELKKAAKIELRSGYNLSQKLKQFKKDKESVLLTVFASLTKKQINTLNNYDCEILLKGVFSYKNLVETAKFAGISYSKIDGERVFNPKKEMPQATFERLLKIAVSNYLEERKEFLIG